MAAPKLALWNTPPADLLAAVLESEHVPAPFEVVRARPEACAALLLRGAVDVALVPTTMALQGADGFVFMPGVALSSWRYPYARLVLKRGLGGEAVHVAYDRRAIQERHVARIVLREHYQTEATFVPREAEAPAALLEGEEEAALLAGPHVPALDLESGTALDLGQEWYELANYPMVWGLLAARKDREERPEAVQALVQVAEAAEQHRRTWLAQQQLAPPQRAFFADELRLRFDDLAIASLTELKQYLFYYDVLGEIPSLTLAEIPEGGAPGANGRRPRV